MEKTVNKKPINAKIISCIPYLVVFAVMIFIHIKGYKYFYDDVDVSENMADTLLETLKTLRKTYQGWSSRTLINPLIWIVYRFGRTVWIILDSLIFTYIFKGINYICFKESSLRNTCILMLLMLQFPFYIVTTAGWEVTTMTYVWPAAAAVGACYSIRYYLDNEKISIPRSVLMIVLTLYAANKEELSVMFFVMFGVLLIVSIKDKKILWLCTLQFVIAVISVFFHFFSTGNQTRGEIYSVGLTKVDKFEIGFSTTFFHMFVDFDTFTAGFCVVLAIGTIVLAPKIYQKLVGIIPLAVWIAACIGEEEQFFGLYCRQDWENYFEPADYISAGKYQTFAGWGQLVLILITVLAIAAGILAANKASLQTVLMLSILTGGYAGRMAVGFGERGWLANSRTYTFFYLGMIIVEAILLDKILDKVKTRKKDIVIYIVIGITILQFFINVIMLGIVDIGLE